MTCHWSYPISRLTSAQVRTSIQCTHSSIIITSARTPLLLPTAMMMTASAVRTYNIRLHAVGGHVRHHNRLVLFGVRVSNFRGVRS